MIRERTIRDWNKSDQVIATAAGHLHIEEREYWTTYRLRTWNGYTHRIEVRTLTPLPIYQRQIIYARTIPWFMWIWYGIAGLPRRIREMVDFWQAAKNEKTKHKAIRAYQRRVLEKQFLFKNRFGGRYR